MARLIYAQEKNIQVLLGQNLGHPWGKRPRNSLVGVLAFNLMKSSRRQALIGTTFVLRLSPGILWTEKQFV